MKRTISILAAAALWGAMSLPAFAQVGAGVAGNASVGDQPTAHFGANADTANSDAERAEPASPTDTSPTAARRHALRNENSPTIHSNEDNRGIGTNSGNGVTVKGLNGNAEQRRNMPATDNSPNGGY